MVIKILKAIFGNSKVAWSICSVVIIVGAVFLHLQQNPLPVPPPPNPGDPVPTIIGNEHPIACGEMVELRLVPYQVKPNNLQTFAVDWKVYDGDKLVQLRDWMDAKTFPIGCVSGKKYDVMVTVTYLYTTESGEPLIKNAFVKSFVYADKIVPPEPPVPPVPVDPVFPPGKFQLSKFVYDNVRVLVPNDNRASASKALADSFNRIALAIDASTIKTSDDALKKLAESNRKALTDIGVNLSHWDAWGLAIQEKLYKIDDSGVFSNSVHELRVAFAEIIEGLRAIKN